MAGNTRRKGKINQLVSEKIKGAKGLPMRSDKLMRCNCMYKRSKHVLATKPTATSSKSEII